ncbi:MAG: hypothetical protein K5622_03605, partial [Endomicrobiaceae bacterium]|nr:hypothetical protein [Endomicrobiaceae bacterium]
NKNSDNKYFDTVVSKLIALIRPENEDFSQSSFNKNLVKKLTGLALEIYKPIVSEELSDKSLKEYKDREKVYLDIFRSLAFVRLYDNVVYCNLFNISQNNKKNSMGFTPEALNVFINAAKKNNSIITISLPDEEFISDDIDKLSSMIVDSIEYIDPLLMFKEAFSEKSNSDVSWNENEIKDKDKKLSYHVMKKMLSLADDDTVDLKKRQRIASILMSAVFEGLYKTNNGYIPIDYEQVKALAEKFNVPEFLHMGNTSTFSSGKVEYAFTPLINFISKNILQENPLFGKNYKFLLENEQPVLTQMKGKTVTTNPDVKKTISHFEILQKILEYNKSVLLALDNLQNSKNYEKDITELLNELQLMINELKRINKEDGKNLEISLEKIKKSLSDTTVSMKDKLRQHLLLSTWSMDKLKDITGIHTLINAVHQVSIADFKESMGDVKKDNSIQVIQAKQKSTIKGYNLSNKVNSNVQKFLSKLATRNIYTDKIDDFICKDDLIVWSTILNAHSVDIFFNFGEVDRGISIYYRESLSTYEDVGKMERLRYFKDILKYLGFFVEEASNDEEKPFSLKATLNKDYGMNDAMDLVDIATHVVEIFKYSTNVDFDLKARKKESSYEEVYKRWLEKAKRREFFVGFLPFNSGNIHGYGTDGMDLDKFQNKRLLSLKSLNAILEYLGCDLLPKDIDEEKLKNPAKLDKYFNKPIERAYAEGRIMFNEDGVLVRTEDYDIARLMIDEINNNFEETTKQSRIVNLVNSYEFDTNILANIGNFVIVSSIMELKTGDKLFVKGIMDPNTKRMKYAIAEKVNTETRQKLTSDELTDLLAKEGYDIPKQEGIEKREEQRIRNSLLRQVQSIESPNIPAASTSEGTGVSVVGNITFKKDKVNEKSILLVPYTTPDDIKAIKNAKGIITTGGGVLSHAAITTRELKKPSVVINGATWSSDENNEVNILYYLPSDEVEKVDDKYYVQKVKTERTILKEGSRVLMNGETGTVLLFDDIDISLLDKLQKYINKDNSEKIIAFMKDYSNDADINRLVEYVYFQAVGNPETTNILDCLFSDDMPDIVKNKVIKLNDSYIQDKIQSISEAIANLKTIDNVNIAYTILQELNKKLEFIKTVGTKNEIESLKNQIKNMEQDIKTKLNLYLQNFINDMIDLLNKKELNNEDIKKIITMLKNAQIYNCFVSDEETSEELLKEKEMIQILVYMIKDKVNEYDNEKQIINLTEEISLFEENADNENLFGSKTAQLAKMFKVLKNEKGVVVPGGIGISVNVMPMLFKLLGKENLLTDFENAIKTKNKQKAKEIAKEICDLIDSDDLIGTKLEKGIKKELDKFIKPGQKYSVRSSGVGEDATNNAFAGMGETELNVKEENIYENIKKCWKSFFAERCIDYMISSNQVVKPAVLVEEMIDSEISGVVFSREKYGNGRINAVFGQGEGLVSGKLTPDSILFDMKTGDVVEYLVANKQLKFVTDVDGGIKKIAVGQKAKSRALNSKMVKKLSKIIENLENSAGYPIDVEFAIKGTKIYILQMRPITTLDTNKFAGAGSVVGEQEIQNQEVVEAKYGISLMSGKIKDKNNVFVNIANPLNVTESIPVYLKSVDSKVTEFMVDSKYSDIVKSGLLGRMLLYRINSDPVVLKKLNSDMFNYKSGEIELLPVLDENIIEKSLFDSSTEIGIENVRNILASA